MRSFLECLDGHAERKTLSQSQIDELKAEYERHIETRGAEGNDDATAETIRFMTIKADRIAKSRRSRALHFQKVQQMSEQIHSAFNRWQAAYDKLGKVQRALLPKPSKAKLYRDILSRADRRGDTLMAEYVQLVDQVIDAHSRKMQIVGNAERLESFNATIKALLDGGEMKGSVGEMAQALKRINETIVRDYRAAGGIIGRIDNYAPQIHDRRKILARDGDEAKSRQDWKTYIKPLLDRRKMVDHKTGLSIDDTRLDEVLDDIFDSITKLGEAPTGKKGVEGDVFNRRARMRQLHFKDGDSFLKYNEKFGVGRHGLFDAYMNHIAVMARDIGAMQVLGPRAKAAHKSMLYQTGESEKSFTGMMFDTLIGPSPMRDDEPGWLRWIEGAKNITRASLLDQSGITALNDVTFAKLAADMSGMSGWKATARWMRNVSGTAGDLRLAQNGGHHISASLMAQSMSMARAVEGDGLWHGRTVAINNWTQRASMMHHVTNSTANTLSQTLAFEMGGLIKNRVRFNKINELFRQRLDDAGITEDVWNKVILKTDPQKVNTDDGWFLLPEDVAKTKVDPEAFPGGAQEIARKLSDLDIALRYEATNAPQLALRAASTLGRPSNSKLRQGASAALMFKSFPIQVMLNHLLPTIHRSLEKGFIAGGGLNASLTVGTLGMTMGMITIQMKELLKGRTERELDGSLVRDAFIISGFGGLAADLVFRDRDGRPLQVDLLGPLVGLGVAPLDLIQSYADAADESNDYGFFSKVTADTVRKARTYIPGADLPYWSVFTERYLLDNIEQAINPELFGDRADRLQSRVLDPQGQEHWFEPAKGSLLGLTP